MAKKTKRDELGALHDVTWVGLNDWLRDAAEADCAALLAEERASHGRRFVLLRTHSRLNKVRAARERAELKEISK